MKQREYLVKSSFDLSGNPEPVLNISEQNTIVAIKPEPNNLIQKQPQQSMNNFTPLSPIPEIQDKTSITNDEKKQLFELLNKISDTQKIQNSILNKLIVSQISILEKLK